MKKVHIEFIPDLSMAGRDKLKVNGFITTHTIPRWLLNKLSPKDCYVMEGILLDMFKAGVAYGEQAKSNEIKDLISKLKKEVNL